MNQKASCSVDLSSEHISKVGNEKAIAHDRKIIV